VRDIMFDALLRQIKDRLLASVAEMLNIPPNLVTAFSLILGGLTVVFYPEKALPCRLNILDPKLVFRWIGWRHCPSSPTPDRSGRIS